MEQDKANKIIEWLQIFNGSDESYTPNSLSDGFIFAKSLHQIDSVFFSDEKLLSKIKQDADNWRLKVSNLRKIVDALYDYYSDVMGINLTEELKPDVNKIGEKSDTKEIGKLVQLILGCAVNCADKEQYITQIMDLEEELQRNIMRAIQDIEYIWQNVSPPKNPMSLSMDIKQLTEERDALAQRCHESDMQISSLLEDKSTLMQELTKLQTLVDKYENPDTAAIGDDGTSLGPAVVGSARYNEKCKQVASLKEDLLQAETAKDDLKMKCIQYEKDIIILQAKIEDLSHYQAEVASLRDEIDALKESNEKAKLFEKQLEVYKKKMEDYNDLKRQLKTLEERSAQYAAENRDFESTTKDKVKLKGQLDLYKKEIDDLNERLDLELNKITKYEYDLQNLNSKLTAVQRERDTLRVERDQLLETVDELRCDQNSEFSGKTVSSELGVPAAFREKLERLDAENKALRAANGGQTALADLLAEANTRADKLREQLKEANQKVLHLQDANSSDTATVASNDDNKGDKDSNASLIASLQAKIVNLESTVSLKTHDLTAAEVRYKKLLEKAKDVIKSVDQNGTVDELLSEKSSDTEVRASPASMSQFEERLVASAFYNLGVNCQRDAVDARLALINSPGQSFLARQRQPAPRKPLIATTRKQ